MRRSRRARDATRHRRTTALLSNTHCIARPGKPTNGTSRTGRSNHRFTVTIGDDAIALARDENRSRAPADTARTSSRGRTRARRRRPCSAGQRSPPPSTAATPAASTTDACRDAGHHFPAPAFDVHARRFGVHHVQRSGRQRDRRRPRIGRRTSRPARARTAARPPPPAAD